MASVQGRPVSETYITQKFLIAIVFPAEETILVRFRGYLMIPELSPFYDKIVLRGNRFLTDVTFELLLNETLPGAVILAVVFLYVHPLFNRH